jgi:bifunctional non-homologous end joining protein LigD
LKTGGLVHLRSRNDKDFNRKYPAIVKALADMPDETVLDGEVVGLDESGRPSFNSLQNFVPGKTSLIYYVFDVMVLAGADLMRETLTTRCQRLQRVLGKLRDPIRESSALDACLPTLIESVRSHGLEGLVAKRLDSRYESGQRSGACQKMRVNQAQAFVIAGYTSGPKNFDAIIFGYYDGPKLIYAARTRNGFTPAAREKLFKAFKGLEVNECPFANLPEASGGRWGEGLTADKMKDCRWLAPRLVGEFEFLEWTPDRHLRHARFVRLRDDKQPKDARRD